jgi:phosphomevalonate kinase
MSVVASAPGKLVLLGEYAVLSGVTALVMAVRKRCRARIGPADGPLCRLETRAPATEVREFEPGSATGVALVDAVIGNAGSRPRWRAWAGCLDSTELFDGPQKLGLGSSAAALVAWAGAWSAAAGEALEPGVEALIELHRRFQGGAGSGLDVAAAHVGGVIEFTLEDQFVPRIGSVAVPNSVGFAGIFAGSSASTPDLVGRYHQWVDGGARGAQELQAALRRIADRGREAARANDGAAFVAAMADYGQCLRRLGTAMGADLVTREHREIGVLAGRFGVAYKVSGAGGGDLGLAASLDAGALQAFTREVGSKGYRVVDVSVDTQGLCVERRAGEEPMG